MEERTKAIELLEWC